MDQGWHAVTHWIDTTLQRFVWVAQCIIALSILAVLYYATDREAPFQIISVEPASARSGEYVTIRATVRRDVSRKCAADFSRYIFASNGARFDLGRHHASPELIQEVAKMNPTGLSVSVMVPEGAETGPARLVTALEYECNKVHALWPIEVTTVLPFTILP
jgi:hypothetical protein